MLVGPLLDHARKIADDFVAKATDLRAADTGFLQSALIQHGNAAAAEYPELDRIESAEMIEC